MKAFRGLYQRRPGRIDVFERELRFTIEGELIPARSIPFSQLKVKDVGINSPVYLFEDQSSANEGFSCQDSELVEILANRGSFAARLALRKNHRQIFERKSFWIAAGLIPLTLIFFIPSLVIRLPTDWLSFMVSYEEERTFLGALSGSELGVDFEAPQARSLKKLFDFLAEANPALHRLPSRVGISNLPIENAFTIAGGDIVFTTPLLNSSDSVEEILGILGHELGHVQKRHILKSTLAALGVFSGSLFLQLIGAGSLGDVVNVGSSLHSLSYSRDHESEADEFAVRILSRAGVGTDGILNFFDRLSKKESTLDQGLAFLRSHPLSEDRRERICELARKYPQSEATKVPVTLKDLRGEL